MTATAHAQEAIGLRRSVTRLLLGAAVAAMTVATGHAQSTPEAGKVETAIPAPVAVPPEVGAGDFNPKATSVDTVGAIDAAAPTPSVTPVTAAEALGPIPAAVIELLAEEGAAARIRLSADDRAALKTFYDGRNGAPIWLTDGRLSPKSDAARARIAAAADDGLDPSRFRLPASAVAGDAVESAKSEIQFSVGALAYARQAWGGRITPSDIHPEISAKADPFDAAAALVALDGSHDVAATLDGFNPQHAQFQELRKHLIAARGSRPAPAVQPVAERPQIPAGKLMQPGDEDPRVPALRKRLGIKGDADDYYYDGILADAVIEFQKQNKIGASGLVNRQTLRALNAVIASSSSGGAKDDVGLIELNMERWRWLPRDLGAKHVFVDLPDFHLHIVENGRETYESRVIIGKPSNQTPLLSSAINQIVVNPYWNVPVSIALGELSRGSLRGFEVVDSKGRVVDPGSVNWSSIKSNTMRIRQPPGERNALGHIKFMFPNRHSVYLHDTSSRKLFGQDFRALSHGCVRVDKPLQFADALSGDQGWSGAKLEKMVGGKERGIGLQQTIPVHLTYFTAWVGQNGKIETRKDVYGLDARLSLAFQGKPLPVIARPKISLPQVAKAKPKPAAPTQTASAQPTPQASQPAPRQEGPGAWLSRIFGDSRY